MSFLFRCLCMFVMVWVASSPVMVVSPKVNPSMIRSLLMTIPARVDFAVPGLKHSAIPSALIPFFSGLTPILGCWCVLVVVDKGLMGCVFV